MNKKTILLMIGYGVVNLICIGAIVYLAIWGYQHVIVPSFGTPVLKVK
jgi:uncharacterized membrane protein YbhN (UPF0104 family)